MASENRDRRKDGRDGDRGRGTRYGGGGDRRRDRDDRRPGHGAKGSGRGDFRKGGRPSRGGRDDRRPRDGGKPRGGRDGPKGGTRDKPHMQTKEVSAKEAPVKETETFTLTVPSTPQRILFKGVDCEVNGRKDLAMYLYLQGAARMSRGCESNALRMLREMGSGEFGSMRGRVAKNCPEDALIVFDYLCSTINAGHDRSLVETSAAAGDRLAIYCMIRLGEVGADDPLIDVFASGDDERMVEDGLKLLVRKKDSAKAEGLLKGMDERRRLRQSVRVEFIRAMNGDRSSVRRLEELSGTFPEAGFLRGYLDAGDREQYIRDGMPRFEGTVMSVVHELGISDTGYGRYLAALKLRADGEEWIPAMINAAGAGSDDAIGELMPVQNRKDVRKAMASVYLRRNDPAGLVRCYDGEDASYLERYCARDPAKISEVGRLMGGSRQVDWLKKGFLDGVEECRDELVAMARSGEHNNKQLVYTLHDIGAELESAKLYFAMYGDRSLPSVKWLAKVCADEEAKEYVRSRFEEMGDLRTFDSIFVDDGYENRGKRKGSGGRPRDRRRSGKS